MSHHASWLRSSCDPIQLKVVAEHLAKVILWDIESGLPIKGIAVRGLSGIVVGSAVSYLTSLPLILVRKEVGHSHSSRMVEYSEISEYCIIDDFVATGQTIKEILSAIEVSTKGSSTLIKIYLYDYSSNHMKDFGTPDRLERYNWYGFYVSDGVVKEQQK